MSVHWPLISMYLSKPWPILTLAIRKKTCSNKIGSLKFKGRIVCCLRKYTPSWIKNLLSNLKNSTETTPSIMIANAWTKVLIKYTEKDNSEISKSKMPNYWKESWTKSQTTTPKNSKNNGKNKNKSSKTSLITPSSSEIKSIKAEKNPWPLTLLTSPGSPQTSTSKTQPFHHQFNL